LRFLAKVVGLSNVTPPQIAEGRRIAPIVCVQNHYNLAHRTGTSSVAHLRENMAAAQLVLSPHILEKLNGNGS